MKRTNPFRPNSPVNPGMFAGRFTEITALEAALRQTRAGYPRNFLLTGERGIGKTSLLEYVRYLATGRLSTDSDSFNFLVVTIDVESSTSRVGLARKIEKELSRALGESEKSRQFINEAWQVVRRFEAAGVRLRDGTSASDEESLIDELAYSIAKTTNETTDPTKSRVFGKKFDGLLLLLDEADNASEDLGLGSLLKLLLERVQRKDCHNFMVGIAGLPTVREVLYGSHESSLRLFDECHLDRLSPADCTIAVQLCLDTANKLNVTQTTIDDDGMGILAHLSEGYPHFIQQVGYCAFEADSDLKIGGDDVLKGALGAGGAIQQIGNRYYRNDFYQKIQKDSYRKVLRIMAEHQDGWVSKEQIREQFSGGETTLSNALHTLRTRNIIQDKEGERGVYRLRNKAFAWWIKIQSEEPEQLALPAKSSG